MEPKLDRGAQPLTSLILTPSMTPTEQPSYEDAALQIGWELKQERTTRDLRRSAYPSPANQVCPGSLQRKTLRQISHILACRG